jgi:hypothetical protein
MGGEAERVGVADGGGVQTIGRIGGGAGGAGGRGLGAVAGQHGPQQLGGGGRGHRGGSQDTVCIAVADGGQIEVVGRPAARECHVEQLPRLGAGEHGVARVRGNSLGAVHRGRIAPRPFS